MNEGSIATGHGSTPSSLCAQDRELRTIPIDPPLLIRAARARREVELRGYAVTSREAILAVLGAVSDVDACGAHLLMSHDGSRAGLSVRCPGGGPHRLFLRPVVEAGGSLVATSCSCAAGRAHEARALADVCDLGELAFLTNIPRFRVLTSIPAGDLDLFTWPEGEESPRDKYS